jgi:hypothetical protein
MKDVEGFDEEKEGRKVRVKEVLLLRMSGRFGKWLGPGALGSNIMTKTYVG